MLLIYAAAFFLVILAVCAVAYYDVDALEETGLWIAGVLALSVIALLLYGAYSWLRFGEWASISVLDAIVAIGLDPQRAVDVGSWQGVQRVVNWYALSNLAWTLMAGVYVATVSLDAWGKARRKARQPGAIPPEA